MIRSTICVLVIFACLSTASRVAADETTQLKSRGTLVVNDNFDRDELGKPWWSNDARAQRTSGVAKSDFHSQAQLVDGKLQIRRTKGSDHASSVKTPAEFTDAVIELRFRLSDENKFGVNINDQECKTVHAGHICRVEIGHKHVLIQDQKTGNMDLEYRKARDNGASAQELAKWTEGKSIRQPTKIASGKWHDLRIVLQGDSIEVSVDGTPRGEFQSEGIGHGTKRNIALAVPQAVDIDDLKVWSIR